MLEQFSAAIQKVFAAAAGASSWKDALVSIEDLTGSAGAVVDLVPKSGRIAARTLAGSFTEENCAEYARDYQAICPRIRHALAHPQPGIQYDYLFMTESTMDRDPVYAWLGKHELRYYLGSPLADTPSYFAFVSLQRTRRQGHAERRDVELLNLLVPHIAQAVSLADQLGTLRSYRRFGSAMLEALPQAVFALDRKGVLLFANAAGCDLLASADGLTTEQGQLRTAAAEEQAGLDESIRSAMAPLGYQLSGWAKVSRPSGRLPLAVFVTPLPAAEEEITAAGASVLLMVHDIAEHRCADPKMLAKVYGLTETESRLASALSGGHSIESAAALLRMKPATARFHLKAVFRKMEVGRQQDLVRLLTSLSGLAPRPENGTSQN